MIVGKDTKPSNEIYYTGALLLSVLKSSDDEFVDVLDAYKELNNIQKVSISLYLLTLDWLFLLQGIKVIDGKIKNVFKKS